MHICPSCWLCISNYFASYSKKSESLGCREVQYLNDATTEPGSFSLPVIPSFVMLEKALVPQTYLLLRPTPPQPLLMNNSSSGCRRLVFFKHAGLGIVRLLMELDCRLQAENPSFDKWYFPHSVFPDQCLHSGLFLFFRTWLKTSRSQQMLTLWRTSFHVF